MYLMIAKNSENVLRLVRIIEAKEEIDVQAEGMDEMEIGFNPKYLIDVLKNLTEEEILFEINDADKPGVIRKGEEYIYVVLPMQLTA